MSVSRSGLINIKAFLMHSSNRSRVKCVRIFDLKFFISLHCKQSLKTEFTYAQAVSRCYRSLAFCFEMPHRTMTEYPEIIKRRTYIPYITHYSTFRPNLFRLSGYRFSKTGFIDSKPVNACSTARVISFNDNYLHYDEKCLSDKTCQKEGFRSQDFAVQHKRGLELGAVSPEQIKTLYTRKCEVWQIFNTN